MVRPQGVYESHSVGDVCRQHTGFARLPLSGQLGPGQLDSTSFLCEGEWTEVVYGCVYVSVCVCE